MKTLLGGGGFGDSVIVFAKCITKYKRDEFKLLHLETHAELLSSISEFYSSQQINHEIINIPSWNVFYNHEIEYDEYTGTTWHKNDPFGVTWDIDPFPKIIFDHKPEVDILIVPQSGRSSLTRELSHDKIISYVALYKTRRIQLIGKMDDTLCKKYTNLHVESLINRTNVKELVDLICSANLIIGPVGFCTALGGLAGKQIIVKQHPNPNVIPNFFHKDWNITVI